MGRRCAATAGLLLAVLAIDAATGPALAASVLSPLQTILDDVELGAPDAVAVSPDGAHLYVADSAGLVIYRRDGGTGELEFAGRVVNGAGGVTHLNRVFAVTVSPDGAHVYVGSFFDSALLVFERDATTGGLTFVEEAVDGQNGVDGLDGVASMALSPDGAHLYAGGAFDNAVAVFSRDAGTGALTFVEVQRDGVGGVDGLRSAASVVVSPDGGFVYAAGYLDRAIAVFSRNAVTGALTFLQVVRDQVGGVSGLDGASAVVVSPDGTSLYAAAAVDSTLVAFGRDQVTGTLTFVEKEQYGVNGVSGTLNARALAISADGASLYVAGFGEDGVGFFSRNAVTSAVTFVESKHDGQAGVDGLLGAVAVVVSADGAHVYACGHDDQAVAVFGRNPGTGALAFVKAERFLQDGLAGASGVAASPDGANVYVAGFNDDALAVFTRDPLTGELTTGHIFFDGKHGVDGLDGAFSVAVSPDGETVYVAGFNDDALAVFSRDSQTGALSYLEVQRNGAGGVAGLNGARSVAVSPDGAYVYAAGSLDDAVAVFSRDSQTGALSFVAAKVDGDGPIDGVKGASAVAVSPDGAHVYATGSGDNAVALFRRELTGDLTFVDAQFDGVGVDGLIGASGVAVSGDGTSVYVTGRLDNAVAVFARDTSTGLLTSVEVQRQGLNGVNGLAGANSVTVSGDTMAVYVTALTDGAVALFTRAAGTGALSFRQAEVNGTGGVEGMSQPEAVAVSPDGAQVYVPSAATGSLRVFAVGPPCPSSPLPTCRSSAGTAELRLTDNANDDRDTVRFRWLRGDETTETALGDPATQAVGYALCVYDHVGQTATLQLAAAAPNGGLCGGKACWKRLGKRRRYHNADRLPDGLTSVSLTAGDAGKTNIIVRGKGPTLRLPALPLTPRVTVQVDNTLGECWSVTFVPADIIRNEAPGGGTAHFKAQTPP